MHCDHCGTENPEGAGSCTRCGAALGGGQGGSNGLATWSLITGVLGFCVPFLFLVAIVLGIVALTSSRSGRGMAIAGITLGVLAALMNVLSVFYFTSIWSQFLKEQGGAKGTATAPAPLPFPGFFQAQTRARVATAMAEQRNLAVALESYRVFNNRLPSDREFYTETLVAAGIISEPTFQYTLTSPVRHIAALPGDPFTERKAHYGYWQNGQNWILRSVGPDGRPNADLAQLAEYAGGGTPSPTWPGEIQAWFYEPTNGIESNGDIIKTGP